MKHKNNIWTAVAFVLALFLNPWFGCSVGVAAYPGINAQSVADTVATSPNAQEILWEHDVVRMAAQTSPFADNMIGKPGSGKPIIIKNDTTKVAGQQIVIPVVDSLGGRMVSGNGVRVGAEEKLKAGDFLLTIGLGWFGVGMDNAALVQTVIGKDWENLSKELLAKRLQKKQSDDNLVVMAQKAAAFNTIYPNGKTLDTLTSSDLFGTSLIVKSSGLGKDIGMMPMDARRASQRSGAEAVPPIPRFMQFLTDVGARPIKTESAYLEGIRLAKDRGEKNNLFTGDYSDWDNNIIYPWVNVRHGGYGSIGSILQPEALLGTAIVAKATTANIPGGLSSVTAGGITGGGSAAGAAVDRDYFEFFSLFSWTFINQLTGTLGTGTRYFLVLDASTQKVSFFSFTGNTGPLLTGVTRLGSTTTGDYNTTVGNVTWDAGSFTVAADGNGYQGVSEGVIASGSLIMEANANGVALTRGFTMGEMALVAGYGKLPNGKSMANRTNYIAPHGQAYANGIEVSYGSTPFKRPDQNTPNFVMYVMARQQDGLPVV